MAQSTQPLITPYPSLPREFAREIVGRPQVVINSSPRHTSRLAVDNSDFIDGKYRVITEEPMPEQPRPLTGQESLDNYELLRKQILAYPGVKEIEPYEMVCFGITQAKLVPSDVAAQLCNKDNLSFSIHKLAWRDQIGTEFNITFSSRYRHSSQYKRYDLSGSLLLCAYESYCRTPVPPKGRKAANLLRPLAKGFVVVDPYNADLKLQVTDLPRPEEQSWHLDPLLLAYLKHPYIHPVSKEPIYRFFELCRW